MNKILITCCLLFISSSVLTDASIDTKKQQGTILLNAPGTLTGIKKIDKPAEIIPQSALPGSLSRSQSRSLSNSARYNFADESVKFRQFGQQSGRNNPWAEEDQSRYSSPYSSPKETPYQANPWQIGGMPPPVWDLNPSAGSDPYSANPYGKYGSGRYSANPYAPYGANPYSGAEKLYPDFPGDIYRDTNPAAYSSPFNNNYMPGRGGDKFGFPFSPFGMF